MCVDLSSALGFRLVPVKGARTATFRTARGAPGPCRILAPHRDLSASVLPLPRCMPVSHLPGWGLWLPHERHHSSLMGALLLQDDRVVGVVQGVPGDAWGFPLEELERFQGAALRQSLQLVTDAEWVASLLLELRLDPAQLAQPRVRTATGEWENTARWEMRPCFDDGRCLEVGGVVIDASCTVVGFADPPLLPFQRGAAITRVDELRRFSFDALLERIAKQEEVVLVAGADAYRGRLPAAALVPGFATKVGPGFMWGAGLGEEGEWAPPASEEPPKQESPPPPPPAAVEEEEEELEEPEERESSGGESSDY